MTYSIQTEADMRELGVRIGARLRGGECFELIGDVGAGKTTFMKGLGEGLKVDDDVQSPSFTISRLYSARDGLQLEHYDFYRLHDPGIMSYEIKESLDDPATIVAVEWAETVSNVLPVERITVRINYLAESEGRGVSIDASPKFEYIFKDL